MWEIKRTEELAKWTKTLNDDAREAILKNIIILKEIGPNLGRPYVDTLKQSRHKNMKEFIDKINFSFFLIYCFHFILPDVKYSSNKSSAIGIIFS